MMEGISQLGRITLDLNGSLLTNIQAEAVAVYGESDPEEDQDSRNGRGYS